MTHQTKKNSTGRDISSYDQLGSSTNNANSTKPYEAPVLICYGDVRDVTLGGTLGFGESGPGFLVFDNLPPT